MSSISTTSANSAVSSAAQSIISGSTGSSTDLSTLVSALVNAKTAGQSAALTAQQSQDSNTLSAYAALSSALGALQSGIANADSHTHAYAATSADSAQVLRLPESFGD